MEPSHRLLQALLRSDIHAFTQRSFHTVNPAAAFDYSWHIGLIMEKLEAVRQGQIRRLIINLPPRSLKSICTSVAFPAWVLAHQPHRRIITASYSLQLARKHAQDCRSVITSPWYKELFSTRISPVHNDQYKFLTTAMGSRLATSIGGTLTGEGGDIIIIDDPLNAAQAQSPQQRKTVNEWYQQTLVSRLDNPQSGAIILVMQRFHPDDLTGYLMQQEGWEHLTLPLIATAPEQHMVAGKPVYREPGDMLHPTRTPPHMANRLKMEIGAFSFEAQYQQNPVSKTGSMIQAQWFARHTKPPEQGIIIQSWDTAIKSAPGSDFSTCITCMEYLGISYVVDVFKQRLEYPELKKTAMQLAQRFSPSTILIEDKASGQQLIQDLRRESTLPIVAVMPKGDKFSRISAATGMLEAGKISLPHHASWVGDFLQEACNYPHTSHDDQIDALSQYLNWQRRLINNNLGITRM